MVYLKLIELMPVPAHAARWEVARSSAAVTDLIPEECRYLVWRSPVQNYRLAEVRRDLWMSSCPTPLLQQGHPELIFQNCLQMAFEYL